MKMRKTLCKEEFKNCEIVKENEKLRKVLNEVKKYVEENELYECEYDYDYEENMYLSGITDEYAKKELLEILNSYNEKDYFLN